MRIEDVEVINLRFAYPEGGGFRYAGGTVTARVTSIVLVHTDTRHVGIGAAYSHPDLVRTIIEGNLRDHLVGMDPSDIAGIWRKMYGLTLWYGRKGAALSALGGVDIALWDLRGKAEGQPVWRLLGAQRGEVEPYASGLFWHDDLGTIRDEAARHRTKGFRRVKMRIGRGWSYDTGAVEAALEGVGPDGWVHVDGSHRYDDDVAVRMSEWLGQRRVAWFEEPFPPDAIDRYSTLAAVSPVPVAAGENEFGVPGFREILRAKAVQIAQPDACRTGGISEVLGVSALAESLGVRIAPHTWSDAVALVANAHVVASLPHGFVVEVDQTGNPSIDELLRTPLDIRDGVLHLGDGPGLGIELDQTTLARLAVPREQTMLPGNYSDLVFGPEHYAETPPYDRAGWDG